MKKLLLSAMLFAASTGLVNAQTVQKQIVEEGGTPRKAPCPLSFMPTAPALIIM